MNRPRLPFAQAAQRMLNDIEKLNLVVDPSDLDAIKRAAAGELPPFMRRANPAPAPQSASDEVIPAVTAAEAAQLSQPLSQSEAVEATTGSPEVMPNLEPAETTAPYFKKSKSRCSAQKKDSGATCRAWAVHGSPYCVFHDPAYTEALREAQSRGGRSTRRLIIGEARKLDLKFTGRGSIQALIAQVVRLQLLGAISPQQGSQLTKLAGLLVTNARGISNGEDDLDEYDSGTRALISLTDTLVERLDNRELTDRVNAIQDHGAKRQEYLRANEKFAPRTPSYSPSHPNFR